MRSIDPTGIRIPPELKAAIKEAAEENHRSFNAEVVIRLERSLKPAGPLEEAAREARDKLTDALGD